MIELTDYQGRAVRLTAERWRHILDHPELSDMQAAIELAVREPQLVIRSRTNPSALLYYRHEPNTVIGGKWLCVVIKYTDADAFVLTAYLTDRPKKGDVVWRRE